MLPASAFAASWTTYKAYDLNTTWYNSTQTISVAKGETKYIKVCCDDYVSDKALIEITANDGNTVNFTQYSGDGSTYVKSGTFSGSVTSFNINVNEPLYLVMNNSAGLAARTITMKTWCDYSNTLDTANAVSPSCYNSVWDTYNYYSPGPIYSKVVRNEDKTWVIIESPSNDGANFNVFDEAGNKLTNVTQTPGQTFRYALPANQELYFRLEASKGTQKRLNVSREDFIDLKSVKFSASSYSLSLGGTKSGALNFTLNDDTNPKAPTYSNDTAFDSTITYTVKNSAGDSVGGITRDASNPAKYTFDSSKRTTGVYKVTAKTSEGKTCSALFKIAPKKMSTSGISSKGYTTAKSCYSTISWGAVSNVSGYALYIYDSKTKSYVKKAATTKTSYTVKGLSPNKTYYFRIAPYKKSTMDGTTYTLVAAKSDSFKVVTAPRTAPTLKSAKVTKSVYHKAWKEWISGYYDSGHYWHKGHYKTHAAYYASTIKITRSSVSGATSYQSNGLNYTLSSKNYLTDNHSPSTKSFAVKIRTVKKAGNSVSYGPWSKTRTVRY